MASRKLPRVLTESEQEKLVSFFNARYWTPHRNQTMVLVMLDAGLRVGEVVALKVDHVDLLTRRITIREGKGAKDRRVPIVERLHAALTAWYERRAGIVDTTCQWVFPTRVGAQVQSSDVRRVVKRTAGRVRLPEADRVSPHTLRHSFATDLLNETGNLRLVQHLLGHTSVATTQIYTHLADEHLDQALSGFRAASAA